MMGAITAENVMAQLPPEMAAVTMVHGSNLTYQQAICEYMLTCGDMNTPVSIAAGIAKGQKTIATRAHLKLGNTLFVLPWLYLLDPHPDNVRLCYSTIRFDVLYTAAPADVLEPLRNVVLGNPGFRYSDTLYHFLALLILKTLLLVESGTCLARLDALLVSNSPLWKDPVVVANLLPFLWPQYHCFARTFLAARNGKKGLGTIGHLRAAHATLRDHVQTLVSHLQHERGRTLMALLLSEQAPMHFEGDVLWVPFEDKSGTVREVHIIAKMFHPVLHGKRCPLMVEVRQVLAELMEEPVSA
jgi:hypothetical protein